MKHFTITFQPDGQQVSIHSGATILDAAGQAGIILNTVCGGVGRCGKCGVKLAARTERVLACQTRIESDLTVIIPPNSRLYGDKILADGVEVSRHLRPDIYCRYSRIASGPALLGAAVDVGTTTVVARLVDLVEGRTIATESALNSQARYGDDVISRITYASDDNKLIQLQKSIVLCINRLLAKLCRAAGADPEDIYELSVVGNTTMNHLFLGLPVAQLGRAPYSAHSLDARDGGPEELGLVMNPDGNVHVVENIAGFVGADTVAVALAVGLDGANDTTLVVDIGTNGELVLAAGGKLYAASCAAGPALEGARIQCGSRAAAGAIEAVVVADDDIDIDVIGPVRAKSICGSGLIDAVAAMLDLGVIDATGRFQNKDEIRERAGEAIASRITVVEGLAAFTLSAGSRESGGGAEVFLTQRDVREMQLAKGAIAAGIELLLKKVGLAPDEIERILLAGAFGNYIRRESAVRVGLLPNVPVERIHFVGNAAIAGAQMTLLSTRARQYAKTLARSIEYVEIAHEKDFQDVFADAMLFPA